LFRKPVQLIPGSTYVIEAVRVAGQSAVWGNEHGSTYPGGRQILLGVTHDDKDLWFREGILHPNPLT
jgi:hypothetical protein